MPPVIKEFEDVKSWSDAKDYLRRLREKQIRESESVVKLWNSYFEHDDSHLDEDKMNVYEQVCIAALDTGDVYLADKFLNELSDRFTDSFRVRRLNAMAYEVAGDYAEAYELYEELIQEDATETVARKRLIAILKSQGKYYEAATRLNDYLRQFSFDHEAWLELCDLYVKFQNYSKAAFCCEELILSSPQNSLFHQRYGDIKFAEGGIENLETAKSHYAKAFDLSVPPDYSSGSRTKRSCAAAAVPAVNCKALYGCLIVCATLVATSKLPSSKKFENARFGLWAGTMIKEVNHQAKANRLPEKLTQRVDKLIKCLNDYLASCI